MIKEITVRNYLPYMDPGQTDDEILSGLKGKQKYISPKYFYDAVGSELFEEITRLEEYYPTRVEKEILSGLLDMIRINLRNLNIVELGSGDPSKITLLLNQIPERLLNTINYFPVDICEAEIIKSVDILSESFPLQTITGIVADFNYQLHLLPQQGTRMFCFFGSTIGNFTMKDAENFMRQLAKIMNPGDCLLIGMDMVKDIDIIERAYNDSRGITAAFNLNILNVINKTAGTDFDSRDFEHLAFFNPQRNCIEMHLKALRDVEISLKNGFDTIKISKGQTIHTENSHKFSYDQIKQLCAWGGFSRYTICHDRKGWFSMVYALK